MLGRALGAVATAGAAALLLASCSLIGLENLTGGDAGNQGGGAFPGTYPDGGSGETGATGDAQSESGGAGMDGNAGAGDGPAMDGGDGADGPTLPPYRIVFATSLLYSGNLGGVSGADAKCQALAQLAKLPGTFLAWVSSSTTSAGARMTHEPLPYLLVDKTTQVATDWSGLTSGSLLNPIIEDENGTAIAADNGQQCAMVPGSYVWTDTTYDGQLDTAGDCQDWTSSSTADDGGLGNAQDDDQADLHHYWTSWCIGIDCSAGARLYCVQQ